MCIHLLQDYVVWSHADRVIKSRADSPRLPSCSGREEGGGLQGAVHEEGGRHRRQPPTVSLVIAKPELGLSVSIPSC